MGARGWILGTTIGLLAAARPAAGQAVAEVQVSPPTVTMSVGAQDGVFAVAYDGSGNVLVGQQFRWVSSDPNVVRVSVDPASSDVATLIAVAPGVARVEARIGSRSGSAAVQVVAAGGVPPGRPQVGTGEPTVIQIEPSNILMLPAESRQLVPLFKKDDGSLAAPVPVTWRSLNAAVATVSDDGLLVAISQGEGIIEMRTSSGLVARAPIRVSAAPFSFAVPVLSLSPGVQDTIRVIVESQGGRSLPSQALTWRSSDESVVRVTPLGVAHGVGPGEATITASGFLQEQTLPVRVHRPVTELSARPGPSAGPVLAPLGGTVQFEVRALAADGTPVPEASLLWRIDDPQIAQFDPDSQRLSGVAIGETALHVRGPGPDLLEATWEIHVIAGGLLANPRRAGLGVGDTLALAASFTDQEGTPIGPATNVTWSSSDENVASVTASGVVTATAIGTADIIASTPWGSVDTSRVFVQGELLIASTREGTPDLFTLDRASPATLHPVIVNDGIDASGAFSPDGSRIAFVSSRDGNIEIYVANADGSDVQRLTMTEDINEDRPAWTPDGRELVFVAQPSGARAQIWIMEADGSNLRQLTSGEATNFEPTVSPDGGTIAFTSTRDGNYEIYLMNRDGSDQRKVTDSDAKESRPEWFPDGQLGYIREQRAGRAVVIRHDLNAGTASAVTPDNLAITDFAIAPDGGGLALEVSAFASGGGLVQKIYLLEMAPGAAPVEVPLRDAAERQFSPAFRPRKP